MNEKNLAFLKDALKYLGFGEKLNQDISQRIASGEPSFDLLLASIFETRYPKKDGKAPSDSVAYELHFRRAKDSDMYFFNSYRAKLTRFNGEEKEQTFFITKNRGFTAKEAYNMLDGRTVYKEVENVKGEKYTAWFQIDFSSLSDKGIYRHFVYNNNYGFDLEAALARYTIKELQDKEKKDYLVKGLQKGNLQEVSILEEGAERKRFIEAAPKFKSLNLYDENMKRIVPLKNMQSMKM